MSNNGYMVVSLDFELLWGVHDHETKESFHNQVNGARNAIPRLLELFDKYNIHATWGIVGMLMAETKTQLLQYLPEHKPTYLNESFSSYNHFETLGENEQDDPYHYANSLVKLIQKYVNQEIASHTFSHYYCKSEGQTKEQFKDDLNAAQSIAKDVTGKNLESLIFPRNNYLKEYVDIAQECGFKCVRSNPQSYAYNSRSYLARAVRLIDTYFNICGKKSVTQKECIEDGIIAIPASRFFRKYNTKLRFLESLKVSCIKRQMKYAAKNGRIFHLWWHPHNISKNTDILLWQLEDIMAYYKTLEKQYGFKSLTMSEMADNILGGDI